MYFGSLEHLAPFKDSVEAIGYSIKTTSINYCYCPFEYFLLPTTLLLTALKVFIHLTSPHQQPLWGIFYTCFTDKETDPAWLRLHDAKESLDLH